MSETETKQTEAGPKDDIQSKKGRNIRYALGLVVVLLLAVGIYGWSSHRPQKNPLAEKARYDQMIKDSDAASNTDNIYKEKTILETYLKDKPDNKEYLYDADLRMVQSCYRLHIYSCANDRGKEAIKLGVRTDQYGIYELLGDTNRDLNIYSDALKYYQKAYDIVKSSKVAGIQSRLTILQQKIDYMNVKLKKQ